MSLVEGSFFARIVLLAGELCCSRREGILRLPWLWNTCEPGSNVATSESSCSGIVLGIASIVTCCPSLFRCLTSRDIRCLNWQGSLGSGVSTAAFPSLSGTFYPVVSDVSLLDLVGTLRVVVKSPPVLSVVRRAEAVLSLPWDLTTLIPDKACLKDRIKPIR